jgi:hypothetical protein
VIPDPADVALFYADDTCFLDGLKTKQLETLQMIELEERISEDFTMFATA